MRDALLAIVLAVLIVLVYFTARHREHYVYPEKSKPVFSTTSLAMVTP